MRRKGVLAVFQAVVFDFDGTLVDTSEGIFRAVNYALQALGHPADPDEKSLARMIGPAISDGFAQNYGVTDPAAVTKFREYYRARGVRQAAAYPGMGELLAALQKQGVRLGIATIKPEPFARTILERLGWLGRFDSLVGAPMDGSNNDKASLIGQVLEQLGEPDRGRTAMVGDRASDVAGGRKNGLFTVYCGYGFGKSGEEREADAAVHDVGELAALLLGQ